MIFGLKIDIRAEELVELLAARAQYHESRAQDYDALLREPEDESSDRDSVQEFGDPGGEPTRPSLARRQREHAERAQALRFLREHVVAGEVYRLDESDLRRIDLVPSEFTRWLLA